MADDTEIVGSHLKANNGYGQNGYQGASSDTPGQHTTSGFLPAAVVPADNGQTRNVSDKSYPVHPGMKAADSGPKIAGYIHRAKK